MASAVQPQSQSDPAACTPPRSASRVPLIGDWKEPFKRPIHIPEIPRFSSKNADKTAEAFLDSFGEQLSNIGKNCRWILTGEGKTLWEEHVVTILDRVMETHQKEIFRKAAADVSVLKHCWMVGPEKAHAHPTIVIVCDNENIIRRTLRIAKREDEFSKHGFKFKGMLARDLMLKALIGTTRYQLIDKPEETPYGTVNLCGRRIWIPERNRMASVSGTILINGHGFALTVAHPFLDEEDPVENHEPSQPLEFIDSDTESETSTYDDEESEEEEEATMLRKGNIWGEDERKGESEENRNAAISMWKQLSHTSFSSLLLEDFGRPETSKNTPYRPTGRDEPDGADAASWKIPDAFKVYYMSDCTLKGTKYGADWALIELHDPKYWGLNEVHIGPNVTDTVFLESFNCKKPEGRHTVASSPVLQGFAEGSSCPAKLKHALHFSQMWTFHCDSPPGTGISGSWVFDNQTLAISSSVVAGSNALQELLFIPVTEVIDSLHEQLATSTIRLPTFSDALWLAVYHGNQTAVQMVLETGKADPNARLMCCLPGVQAYEDLTVLHWAMRKGYYNIAESLLNAGANPNGLDTDSAKLLRWKADSDYRDPVFQGPLVWKYHALPGVLSQEPGIGTSDTAGSTDPGKGWIWHTSAKDFFRQEWDGVNWNTIWYRSGSRTDSGTQSKGKA